jgi:predicted protein tyrosine phosphatase
MSEPLRILFVCGRNRRRSPTAEHIYRKDPRVSVRSAGVSAQSVHALTAADLEWAELVLAMERRYLKRIRSEFGARLKLPPSESLEIPDEFELLDADLIALIRSGTEHHIEAMTPDRQRPGPTPAPGPSPAVPEPRRP